MREGDDTVDRFAIGDRVTDPLHGFATVTYVGARRVGVSFEDGREALMALEGCRLLPGWEASALEAAEEAAGPPPPWPDSTFAADPAAERHAMGSHWQPFREGGLQTFVPALQAILKEARPLGGFGEVYRSPRQEPPQWARGQLLVWPEQHRGHGMVIGIGGEAGHRAIATLYPYVDLGTQTSIELEKVWVWASGVGAQLEVIWGEARITFFDTAYLLNRGWYETGQRYEFLLAGIAYGAGPATVMRLPLTPDPEQVAWQNALAARRGEPPPEVPDHVDLTGGAFFTQIPQWDTDDYSFRGPIRSVEPFDDFLGEAGWQLRVTVMRFEQDADLDIYVTRRVWEGSEPPAVGQDVEGTLWLQGRLWLAAVLAGVGGYDGRYPKPGEVRPCKRGEE